MKKALFLIAVLCVSIITLPGCLTEKSTENSSDNAVVSTVSDILSGSLQLNDLKSAAPSKAPLRASLNSSDISVDLINLDSNTVLDTNQISETNGEYPYEFSGDLQGKNLKLRVKYNSNNYDCVLGKFPIDDSSIVEGNITKDNSSNSNEQTKKQNRKRKQKKLHIDPINVAEESIASKLLTSSSTVSDIDITNRYAIKTLISEIVKNLSKDDMKNILSNLTGISVSSSGKPIFTKPNEKPVEMISQYFMGIKKIYIGGNKEEKKLAYSAPNFDIRNMRTNNEDFYGKRIIEDSDNESSIKEKLRKIKNYDDISDSNEIKLMSSASDKPYLNKPFGEILGKPSLEHKPLKIYSKDHELYLKFMCTDEVIEKIKSENTASLTLNIVKYNENGKKEKIEFIPEFINYDGDYIIFLLNSDKWKEFSQTNCFYNVSIIEFCGQLNSSERNIEFNFYFMDTKPAEYIDFKKVISSVNVIDNDGNETILYDDNLIDNIKQLSNIEKIVIKLKEEYSFDETKLPESLIYLSSKDNQDLDENNDVSTEIGLPEDVSTTMGLTEYKKIPLKLEYVNGTIELKGEIPTGFWNAALVVYRMNIFNNMTANAEQLRYVTYFKTFFEVKQN